MHAVDIERKLTKYAVNLVLNLRQVKNKSSKLKGDYIILHGFVNTGNNKDLNDW